VFLSLRAAGVPDRRDQHSRLFLLLAGWLRSRDRVTKGMLATSGAIIQIARLYLGYNPIEYTMGAS
jgi:hypothetical protein